ncbi:hypothetical protein MBM_03950 [Drepanopeziza brunnea f. sp. 'multigermtubi' MB_m1]|uniref:Uncharacterized protein n=1 Tax=Marssonina brunnea f. sp. multigermtubi (strain MB_m1) TaxID=1072389 RepID=K1XBT4_MARBU|nr:uncharacterized protein MBM_03950 [Drepanopeziza brunnea f. sp. 'multigermtubi' MB_m1]EKD18178.1 hypothetical protein MBM_03950 [Drepanopeziza brunnea f. sp. 'multigermtubi' MB_m1]
MALIQHSNLRSAGKILRTPFKAALAALSSSFTAQLAVPFTQEEAISKQDDEDDPSALTNPEEALAQYQALFYFGASADRSNRFNKFSFPGNAFRSAIKTLGSSCKDSNTPKLPRHYSVNEIEYGAGPEYGLYSDDSDDGPYSDALEDHQELLSADPDAPDNKGNVEA